MQDMLPDFIFSMMAHQEERSMDGRVRTLPAIVSRVDLLYWFLCITANFKSNLEIPRCFLEKGEGALSASWAANVIQLASSGQTVHRKDVRIILLTKEYQTAKEWCYGNYHN